MRTAGWSGLRNTAPMTVWWLYSVRTTFLHNKFQTRQSIMIKVYMKLGSGCSVFMEFYVASNKRAIAHYQFTCLTSLNIRTNSSLMDRLRLSMSPRRFLRVRSVFSVKNADSAFKASSISYGMKTGQNNYIIIYHRNMTGVLWSNMLCMRKRLLIVK